MTKRNRLIYGLVWLFFCTGCSDSSRECDKEIQSQVDQLETLEDRETYLAQIFEDDQKVRQSSSELIKLNYGRFSKEYREYVNNQMNTDELNVKKVEYYLAKFDHPSRSDSLNYKSMTAIWAVMQHSDADTRERNFEKLYTAHLKGDMDLAWILKRMYQYRKRKDFRMPDQSKYATEVDQLIYELGLEEKKKKVIQNINYQQK